MPHAALPQLSTAVINLVLTLCAAVILALFDVWLRRREVKDPSLIWLCLSLLSWSAGSLWQLLGAEWPGRYGLIQSDVIPYILSPVSSLLLTITAFQLSRMREVFCRPDLRSWPTAIVLTVAGLSTTAILFLLVGRTLVGETIDAVASSVALGALGTGLAYSFYKYGNPLLVGLTGITITFLVSRQFIGAAHGLLQGAMAALNVAGVTALCMLFIALAVAWGLSDTSRLKPVGVPANVTVAAMFFDLRGSTSWSMNVLKGDFYYVGAFLDEMRAWAWRHAALSPVGHPHHVKFLGDGFLFVWELPRKAAPREYAAAVTRLACTLVRDYPSWTVANQELWRGVPEALGIGADVGPAIRLTFENGSDDYVGAPLNIAGKMEDMARPMGGVVIQADAWNLLDPALQELFPKAGKMLLGRQDMMAVRATDEVEVTA